MDTDESFEKWFDDKWKKKLESFPRLERIRLRNIAKAAWVQSRAAIEVELPPKCSHLNMVNGWVRPEAASYDEAIDDCADVLKEAGITVKGE